MTGTELTADIAALAAHNLTALFERIADTYTEGLRVERAAVAMLIEARLVKYARGTAALTNRGWSVSTRIAAIECARKIAAAGPSHVRSRS